MDSTILIIGAGTFGVSTAWHLSQNHNDPSKVTIIDVEAPPPSRSAAADTSRIITSDYASPLYAKLAEEPLSFWSEDPDLEWYFHKVGRLVLDEGGKDVHSRSAHTRGTKSPREPIELDEIGKRWSVLDGTATRGFKDAYLDTEAGWINSETATWQFLETAIRRRVKREVGQVAELLIDRSSKTVKGARTVDGRRFLADTVILATGAWTSTLLSPVEDSLGVAEEDRIERQAQATSAASAYYPVSGESLTEMTGCKMPCVSYGQAGEVVPASRDNKLLRYTNLTRRIVNMVTTRSGRSISVPPAKRTQGDVPQEIIDQMEDTLTTRLMPRFSRGKPKWRMCCTYMPSMNFYQHGSLYGLILTCKRGQSHPYRRSPALRASACQKRVHHHWRKLRQL